jgi:hypothetical protein
VNWHEPVKVKRNSFKLMRLNMMLARVARSKVMGGFPLSCLESR